MRDLVHYILIRCAQPNITRLFGSDLGTHTEQHNVVGVILSCTIYARTR